MQQNTEDYCAMGEAGFGATWYFQTNVTSVHSVHKS